MAAEARLENARASAAIDGVDLPALAWRSGSAFDDSPMGRAAAGIWRLERELISLEPTWRSAPSQALARMHTLVAVGMVGPDELGRPRSADVVADDPLRIGPLQPDREASPLAKAVFEAVRPIPADGSVPAVIESAAMHGELLALRPFRWGSGPIARAASRLVLATRGLDPDLLVAVDVGLASLGRPAYVKAIRGYATGGRDGAVAWVSFCCHALERGAAVSAARLGDL